MSTSKTTIALVATATLLSGCLTTPLSKEDAEAYANLDVTQFLTLRYAKGIRVANGFDRAFNAVGNLFSLGKKSDKSERSAQQHFNNEVMGQIKNSNTVAYKAEFSLNSYSQLNKPYIEMQNYCEAVGGRFNNVYKDTRNFIALAQHTPETVFSENVQRSYDPQLKGELDPTIIGMDTATFDFLVHNAQQIQTTIAQLDSDTSDAEKAYNYAANLGAFGRFACYSKLGTRIWEISILPQSYLPKDPDNDMAPHQLKIVLVPKKLN